MGLLGAWNNNFLDIQTHAVLPYDGRLKYFASYLQQLEMESNGKSIQRNGEKVEFDTCPIVWGEVGPNAQHAFYQLLHQGTQSVSSDFIAPVNRYNSQQFTYVDNADALVEQHHLALSNCLAQSRLLAFGNQAMLWMAPCFAIFFCSWDSFIQYFLMLLIKQKRESSVENSLFSVRAKGLEPPRLTAPDPKSGAATNYATRAMLLG